jgi:hypothetical protein
VIARRRSSARASTGGRGGRAFALAGVLLVARADAGGALAVAEAAVSLALVLMNFPRGWCGP